MSNTVSSSLSATDVSLRDSPHPDRKVCSLFLFLFLDSLIAQKLYRSFSMSRFKACSGRGPTALSVHGCTCVLVLSIQVRRAGELEGHSGSALVPNGHCLDAGEDLPLMAGQSHAHVQQILCGDLGQLVHRVDAGLQEAVFVALHLDGP